MALEALRYLPESAHVLRARANTIAGEHAEAVTIWKKLLEDNKNDPDLWLGLAHSLTAAGSADKAAACREKARGLGADVAEPVADEETEEFQEETNADPDAYKETEKDQKTTKSKTNYTNFNFSKLDIIIFGRESAGVPDYVHNQVHRRLTIPMQKGLRSLNISSSVAMVIGEASRQLNLI